ncbi:hypothetical protein [Streptomyces chartreusis]|uniref:hypothetical protein n=1 Tax=Streptomyces chartreusis TaxID=1969 RepID=UPI0037F3F4AD
MIGGSDIRRITEMEIHARQQAAAEAWPEGVTHRYLTKAAEITGDHAIAVEITTTGGDAHSACTGCGHREAPYFTREIHSRAQNHAERCLAVPRPVTA